MKENLDKFNDIYLPILEQNDFKNIVRFNDQGVLEKDESNAARKELLGHVHELLAVRTQGEVEGRVDEALE